MGIKKIKKKSGEHAYQIDWRDEHGKRHRLTFKYKDEAIEELLKHKAGVVNVKKKGGIKRVKFSAYCIEWLKTMKADCASRNSMNTYDSYSLALNSHFVPIFGERYLCDITPQEIRSLKKTMLATTVISSKKVKDKNDPIKYLSTSSIRNYLTRLGTLLKSAYKEEITERDLSGFIEKPKIVMSQENKRPFNKEEIEVFFQNCPVDYKFFYAICFFTGMRTGEVLALRFGDVDLKKMKLHVNRSYSGPKRILKGPKNGGRMVDIIPVLEGFFANWKHLKDIHGDLIFPGYDLFNLRKKSWIPILRTAKIPFRKQYVTRHTFASHMLSEGQPAKWVANNMGDALETVLREYDQWLPTEYKANLMTPLVLDKSDLQWTQFGHKENAILQKLQN